MKTAKKFSRLLAIALVLSCFMTVLLPFASAVEPRYTSNGYSSTTVTYSDKTYTIYVGVAGISSKVPYVTAFCPIDNITVKIGNTTAKFDTKNYGYVTDVGPGKTDVTFAKDLNDNNPSYDYFHISSPYVTCSKGTGQVISVLRVTNTTVFKDVNVGQDASVSMTYTAQ